MDLAGGIICIVLAVLFITLGILLLIGSDGDSEFIGPGTGISLAGLVIGTIGIILTVASSQNYSKVTNQIITYRDADHFTIGMVRGEKYQMLDYYTRVLIEKPVSSSTIVRDEEEHPYIVEHKHVGDKTTYYYIHVPADVVIFAM